MYYISLLCVYPCLSQLLHSNDKKTVNLKIAFGIYIYTMIGDFPWLLYINTTIYWY